MHYGFVSILNLKTRRIKCHVWRCSLKEGEHGHLQLKYFISTTICMLHPFLLMLLGLYFDQTNSGHEQVSLCVSQAGI